MMYNVIRKQLEALAKNYSQASDVQSIQLPEIKRNSFADF